MAAAPAHADTIAAAFTNGSGYDISDLSWSRRLRHVETISNFV
jgi:hypothetical protein